MAVVCAQCGSGPAWFYPSTAWTEHDGVTTEWACGKCGSREFVDGSGEGGIMATRRGACDNCDRPDLGLQRITGGRFLCSSCRKAIEGIPPGPERERILAEKKAELTKKAGGSGLKVPPPPDKGSSPPLPPP